MKTENCTISWVGKDKISIRIKEDPVDPSGFLSDNYAVTSQALHNWLRYSRCEQKITRRFSMKATTQ